MILDTKKQKEILIQIIESGNYPGKVIEEIVELKKSILLAEIDEKKDTE